MKFHDVCEYVFSSASGLWPDAELYTLGRSHPHSHPPSLTPTLRKKVGKTVNIDARILIFGT